MDSENKSEINTDTKQHTTDDDDYLYEFNKILDDEIICIKGKEIKNLINKYDNMKITRFLHSDKNKFDKMFLKWAEELIEKKYVKDIICVTRIKSNKMKGNNDSDIYMTKVLSESKRGIFDAYIEIRIP